MTFQRLFRTLKIKETNIKDTQKELTGVNSDSRKIENGNVFVCLTGRQDDGHMFVLNALAAGAAVVVCEYLSAMLPQNAEYVLVDNTRIALALLCNEFYGCPSEKMKLVGITGTNGKTSTAQMLKHVFTFAGKKCEAVGTLDGGLTTPDCEELYKKLALFAEEGYEYVFMEVSSHALSLEKAVALKFELGIFTNLSREHLDFHTDMNEYALTKAKLFYLCGKSLFNNDDVYTEKISRRAKNKHYYSIYNLNAGYAASNIINDRDKGISYDLVYSNGMFKVSCPLPGMFNVYNTLSAISASLILGLDHEIIRNAFRVMPFVKGRLERIDIGSERGFSVYIDYAHTPDALEKVLKTMREFRRAGERIILLFGCGGDRDRGKRRVMGQIASRYADFTVITSDNSRSENRGQIIAEILRGIDKESAYTVIEDRKKAIEVCIKSAKKGDMVLLAGKGHEDYEITKEGKKPFSEKEIVRQILMNDS